MRFPFITAHTGCMGTEPNSVESVMQGIRAGADIIEVDVRATRDGVAVLGHDDCLEIPASAPVLLSETDYTEITARGGKPVRLDEVLALVRDSGRTVNLDLKTGSAADAMIRTVLDMNLIDGVIITGCEKKGAMEITSRYRGFRVLMDVDTEPLLAGGFDYGELVKMWCRDAVEACCCAFNIHYRVCAEELVERAAKSFLPVSLYTVDEESLMKKYMEMGAFSITTNRVDLLKGLKDR